MYLFPSPDRWLGYLRNWFNQHRYVLFFACYASYNLYIVVLTEYYASHYPDINVKGTIQLRLIHSCAKSSVGNIYACINVYLVPLHHKESTPFHFH
jgi:hypothetical protein